MGNQLTTISLQPVSRAVLLGGAFMDIFSKLPGEEKFLEAN